MHFIGMGVSGGEEGARYGPSLMVGGKHEQYSQLEPIFSKCAAQVYYHYFFLHNVIKVTMINIDVLRMHNLDICNDYVIDVMFSINLRSERTVSQHTATQTYTTQQKHFLTLTYAHANTRNQARLKF